MIAWLLAKFGGYLTGAALGAALLAGGYGWVQGMRLDRANAKIELKDRQIKGYQKAVKILKEDAKRDAETQYEKDKIDVMAPDQFGDYIERLRQRAAGAGKDSTAANADD